MFEAIERGEIAARVGVVISSRPNVPALRIAAQRGIPTRVLRLRDYTSRAELGAALVRELREARVELVALAGYNLIFDPVVLRASPMASSISIPRCSPRSGGAWRPSRRRTPWWRASKSPGVPYTL